MLNWIVGVLKRERIIKCKHNKSFRILAGRIVRIGDKWAGSEMVKCSECGVLGMGSMRNKENRETEYDIKWVEEIR